MIVFRWVRLVVWRRHQTRSEAARPPEPRAWTLGVRARFFGGPTVRRLRSQDTQRLTHEINEHRRTETVLRSAQAAAEQANISKTKFIAAASHDLYQPLNAARLFLSTLADSRLTSRARTLIAKIEASLNVVDDLLTVLLQISRLDSGSWPTAVTDFRIGPLLADLASEYELHATACGLRLVSVPSTVTVRSDRSLLERILRNYLSNAIRYTEQGRVLIGCRRRSAGVSIEVWDTGIGIPEDKIETIFEEFSQLEGGPRRQRERGIGLGLAIVERIARLLGLKVEVSSRLGFGSKFSIVVPYGDTTRADLSAAEPLPRRRRAGYAGKCIVLIDNEEEELAVVDGILRSWDCDTICATSARDALDRLEQRGRRPDAAIVDYHLGGDATGATAMAALESRFGCRLNAVILSNDRSPELAGHVKSLGYRFLPKPAKAAKLRPLIAHLLGDAP